MIAGNRSPNNNDLVVGTVGDFEASTMNYSLVGSEPSGDGIDMDPVSQSLLGQNPLLGPLVNNGGSTLTHLPFAGSPLLDAIPTGESGCGTKLLTDQRGEPRPQNGACDIGVVEGFGTPPESLPVPVLDRAGLLLMSGLLGLAGLFGLRRRWRGKAV